MSERYDEHGCLVVGNVRPHKPFEGRVSDVFVGYEAEKLLRRVERGELPGMPVSVVVTYDSDHPENRETYVWADGDDDA